MIRRHILSLSLIAISGLATLLPFAQASFASECAGLRPETKSAWEAALKQSDEGHALWATGDASAIKKMWAKTDDVTIFGGLGAYERGWNEVGPRLDWSASQFSSPTSGKTDWQRELISVHECDQISIATQIERFTARFGPANEERRREVRVTLIWRKDLEGWRIVHRHGDPVTPKSAPK